MKHIRIWKLINLALGALFFLPSFASAQYDDYPPSRVARVSSIRGAVSFEPAGTQDWVDATINRPMTTGDGIWSDRDSRAALHIGSASIHLSENTGLSFLNLTDQSVQIQLTTGSVRIRVKRLGDNENFEVDTPNLAFSVLRPGIYRVTVDSAGDSTIIEDRRGEGEVTGEGSAYAVHAGEVDTFSGTNQLSADVEPLGYGEDDFERWSQERDHHEDISISARYMSDDAIGYDDLDDNGGWRPVPQYGMIWFPHVQGGWAPYHYGHWAYIAPWGYTWVDDADWGFAPFHYGRWVSVGDSWGWVPCPPRPIAYGGPVYIQPVYAPALVAWIGGISVGVGVGWFPLGPREVYVPSYPVNRTYFNNVNVSNTTVNTTVINNYYTTVIVNKQVNVTNVTYINRRVNGAVAATTPEAFSSGRSISTNQVRLDSRMMTAAPVTAVTPPTVPQRASVLGGRAMVNVRPPAAIQARAVVVKAAPPPPPPSFERRQAAIQSNGGRPLSIAETRQIAPERAQQAALPQVKVAPPSRPGVPQHAPVNRVNAAPLPPPAPVKTAVGQPPARIETPAPTAHPVPQQLEQRHEQQSVDLHQKQDQQFEELQQRQQRQLQQVQAERDAAAKQQQLQQEQREQVQQLEQKHQQQQQELQRKQEAEHERLEKQQAPKPTPQEKPQPKPKNEPH